MKPFHMTDRSKLKVHCPEKYRIHARRVEGNIRIFQSKMLVSSVGQRKSQATCKATGAGRGTQEGLAPVKPADVQEAVESTEVLIPQVTLIDEDEAGADPTVHYRSMSRESLMKELTSPPHNMCHFHSPSCDICVKANLKQRKFAHSGERSDDGLPCCEVCG